MSSPRQRFPWFGPRLYKLNARLNTTSFLLTALTAHCNSISARRTDSFTCNYFFSPFDESLSAIRTCSSSSFTLTTRLRAGRR